MIDEAVEDGGPLRLQVFVDRSIVEVFANVPSYLPTIAAAGWHILFNDQTKDNLVWVFLSGVPDLASQRFPFKCRAYKERSASSIGVSPLSRLKRFPIVLSRSRQATRAEARLSRVVIPS